MRVAVFPADEQGCGWYRMRWPAAALEAAGLDISIRDRIGSLGLRYGTDDRLHVSRLTHDPDYDLAVFQRPFSRMLAESIPALQAVGVAVVVDMDDDASALPGQHPAFRELHPRWSPEENWQHAEAACRAADMVTVSTPALAKRYGGHGRVRVVRNCIPSAWLEAGRESPPPADGDGCLVGWTGAFVVHAGDLEVTRGGIARALRPEDRLRVSEHAEAGLELDVPPAQTVIAEWQQLTGGYPQWVADLDVGIAPLAANRFNDAKSALRGLEYAALGVPFVASPSPEYRWLLLRGAGLLAPRPKDWTRHLRLLLQSAEARAELAGEGRQVAAQWTFDRQAHVWAEAWCAALERRRSVTVATPA